MSRCRSLVLALCATALCVHVNAEQYSHNMFLNGEYKNSISEHAETYASVNPARNIFLNHAIISRQASPFTGPIYLPPHEYLKCTDGQQCVRKGQCQGGYFRQQQPKIQNCEPETDVCCTYVPPPTTTTTTTTRKPYKTCNRDQDCVSSLDCRNGEIVAVSYIKTTTSNICYEPEVCCRMPTTTLTDNGYILHKPDKSFLLPTNPTVPAQRPTLPVYVPQTTKPAYRPQPQTTPAPYRPQPTQTPVVYRPQPTQTPAVYRPQPTQTPAVYRPQPTQTPAVYRPQPTSPPSEYLPPQTTESRQTPRPTYGPPPTQTPYRPQPTQTPYRPQPTQTPYRPQPTQTPYRPQPTQTPYRPQPTQTPYRPQPTQTPYRPQPTQPPYRPQPTYHPESAELPNEYLPPKTTQKPQTPKPYEYRPQPTQPQYRPQPTQPQYRPQPTQPEYRPQPTQPEYRPRPTQPEYRPEPKQPEYRPRPTQPEYRPQPTQPAYRPQPTQTAYRPQPTQPEYRPQPTQPAYRPQPTQPEYRPQPTKPTYRPQPTTSFNVYLPPSTQSPRQPPRPQPTQPAYRPQPTQPAYRPQPTQPAYRPQPTQPTYRPKPITEYLPPVSTNEIDRQPQPSNVRPMRGEDQLSPQIFPPSKGGSNLSPVTYARCASALVCTAENYCNSIGVISETPVNLSPSESAFRVPLTNCLIEGSGGQPGKCCRDPNYVDPWPVNLAGVCASRNRNTKPAGVRDIDANFAEIPWQAMILKDSTKSLLCGGAIIGDEFVVTAASCVSGVNPSDVRIKAGEWELGRTSEPLPFQLVAAKTIDIHPEYNPSTGANDMAIIRLQKRLEFATHIQPICISDEDPSPSEQCVTTGWGKQALQIHEEGAIMHVTSTSPVSRSDCGADGTSVCSSTKFDSCEFDTGSALACGTGSNVRLKGVYTVENACGENQVVRFSKPDIKWINTAFADRNKPLLLKRV